MTGAEQSAIDSELRKSAADFPLPPNEITRLEKRKWILRHAQPGGVGAEVGVFRGHFSEILIDVLKPRKIYLIDLWTKLGEFFNFKGPYTNEGTLPTKLALREVELRTKRFTNAEVKIIEGYSVEELQKIKEKLDWVYIDASHSYENVLKDLYAAAALLTPKGVIMGDDWYPNPALLHHGVFRAVQDFVRATDFQVIGAGQGAQYCLRRQPSYDAPAKA